MGDDGQCDAHERADEAVFTAHYLALRRFAASYGSALEPDDLVQEALTRTLARHRLADLEHPRTYLMRTIMNLVRNEYRHEQDQVRKRRLLPGPDVTRESYPSDVEFLLDLPADLRAALILIDLEGFSFGEVADVLGTTSSALRARVSRTRRRLRTQLSEQAEVTRD
jgi:RNA polymerase sigma-70 factor (ECF subfamily)